MDVVSPEKRSHMMAGIRSSNTRPEIVLRKFLHANGFRYRLGTKILHTAPDLVLRRYRTAIFAHGCFWHRHANCRYATNPASNVEKWQEKFGANLARDQRVIARLLEGNWRIAIIWECWEKRGYDIGWLPLWIREGQDKFVSWPEVSDRV